MAGGAVKAAWRDARASLLMLVLVFAALMGAVALVASTIPALEGEDATSLYKSLPPRTLEEVLRVRDVVMSYGTKHRAKLALVICFTYVAMQTVAIPGTITLSVLIGAIFGRWAGWPIVCAISTAGSATSYLLARTAGRPLVHALYPARLEAFQQEVASRRSSLFNYMLFLRLTPFLPNIFINVAAPIAGIPFWTFAGATLIGVAPNNFMAASAGANLSELRSLKELYSPKMAALALLAGCLALVPVLLSPKPAKPGAQEKKKQ